MRGCVVSIGLGIITIFVVLQSLCTSAKIGDYYNSLINKEDKHV